MCKRFISLILVLTLFITIFSSCAPQTDDDGIASKVGEAVRGGTITLSCERPDTLNPLKTEIQSNYNALMLIFEGLFLVQENQQALPVLATGYDVSDDGLKYTINLKPAVKFHDGKMFGAKDVIYTMNNMKKYCPKYFDLFENIDLFYPLGDNQVIIELKEPSLNFINNLTFPVVSEITPLSAFEEFDINFIPIGTGEFKYVDKMTRNELILHRNPDWHSESGYADQIKINFVDDIHTAMHSFNANLTHLITTNEFKWGDFSFTENYRTYEYENNVYCYMGFNPDNALLSGTNIRTAIYTAVDREHVVKNILNSHAVASYIPIAQSSYFYPDSFTSKTLNKDVIKSLIDADGWVDIDSDSIYEKNVNGENFKLSFVLLVNSDELHCEEIADNIASTLLSHKIEVKVKSLSADAFSKAFKDGEYDLVLRKAYMDSAIQLDKIHGAISSDLNDCLYEMKLCKTQDEFKSLCNEFGPLFESELPHVPLFFETSAVLCKNVIHGSLQPTPCWPYNGISHLFVQVKDGVS